MHRKEEWLNPIFDAAWGCALKPVPGIDTDILGTFSGEVPRPGDVPTTLRRKVALAADRHPEAEVVVATEGSFGPDPVLGWIPLHEEVLLWAWPHAGAELWVTHRSHDTNFSACSESDWGAVRQWAERVGFPAAHLILRRGDGVVLAKGLRNWTELEGLWRETSAAYGVPSLETDMRADRNPRRQEALRELARKTVESMHALCPSCGFPGFVPRPASPGAPCRACGAPTRLPAELRAECRQCHAAQSLASPHQLQGVDPGQCDRCNP
jgi:hypothetical protein